MAPDLTPQEIRNTELRNAFRGVDRTQVEGLLAAAALRIEELEGEATKLSAQLAETPRQDMEAEFEKVGRDISAILQAAREAAETMRERASLDAARWRSEALEESEQVRKDAAADAEALRRDAWVTGTELLEQAVTNAEAMRATAERDVLTVMGEAEREAHRLTSGARRDAEDHLRSASMEAEKITAEAAKRRGEIIDRANQDASAAQQRTRALELRRDELLEELDNVRATLAKLEGSIDERRDALDISRHQEPSSVKVVHPPADAAHDWGLGETVRVVPTDSQREPDTGMADEVSEQVARIQHAADEPEPKPPRPRVRDSYADEPGQTEAAAPEPKVSASTEPEAAPRAAESETPQPRTAAQEAAGQETAEPGAAETETAGRHDDDLDSIFASLRGGGDTVSPAPAKPVEEPPEPAASSEDGDEPLQDGTDWIAVRDTKLLPVTNRALRGVKKAMTEIQNVALDELRTTEEWEPDVETVAESLHAELLAVWSESFAAGHAVAEEMVGDKLKRPATPASSGDKDFAADLTSAVKAALASAGEGTRERQSAVSRVFRVWRSDEAERRIRDIAILGYETGIERSRRVTTG